jgi:hypothetical protein
MTCPKCNAPIDHEIKFCMKCGIAVVPLTEKPRSLRVALWKMGKVFLWGFLVLALLLGLFCPTFVTPIIIPNMSAVASRGRDIYVAITSGNVDREPFGLPALWPRTYQAYSYMLDVAAFKRYKTSFDYFCELFNWANDGAQKHANIDWKPLGLTSRWEMTCLSYTNLMDDMAFKAYQTSSDYFYELYDGANAGTERHDPYVKGFDYSKLSGAGVPSKHGREKLEAKNNMWLIAANIADEDEDSIPFLITRNVDVKEIERVVNQGLKASDFKTRVECGKGEYKTPFGKEGFVGVRKGGNTFNKRAKHVTLGELFDKKELPPRDPSKPPIVYLMP